MFITFLITYKMFVRCWQNLPTSTFVDSARPALTLALVRNHCQLPITISRRYAAHLELYVHKSIAYITKRRADLESERVDCMWVEVKHSSSDATLVGYVYRYPAAAYAWLDCFVDLMDINKCDPSLVLLGVFNIEVGRGPKQHVAEGLGIMW